MIELIKGRKCLFIFLTEINPLRTLPQAHLPYLSLN